MPQGNVLIIDDEDKLRGLLARIIGLEGYTVWEAANGKAGLKVLEREDIQLVISDVKLPDANGVELAARIKSSHPAVEVIVLTAYGTIADGVKAIQNGAFDYITKGDDNDRIIPLVSRATEKARLQQRVQQLENRVGERYRFERIIGHSAPLRQAIELARKVAVTDTTVLLLGETGTGKEVFAQAIHHDGERRLKPFVAVNCSTLGKEILESELFGYRAGSFTGAVRDKKGLLEEANGGTLFLDEIGEMPLELQAKLLRVLETSEFLRVGDTRPTRVNARFIAATNRELPAESEAGRFRLDLFYRLAVFQIRLPTLRERPKDIDLLATHFGRVFADKMNRKELTLTEDFREKLRHHPWKGNIRELKNVMERAVILADNEQLTADLLPLDIQISTGNENLNGFDLATVEKQHIQRVLLHTKGNKTQAAKLLNIGLTTLYQKIKDYGIGE